MQTANDIPDVDFFDRDRYNFAVSVQDNILFGRLAYGRARSSVRIGAVIGEVVEKLGLRRMVMQIGLDYSLGIGGSRLSLSQRQKLSIARAMLKRPEILIMDNALSVLDPASQTRVLANVQSEFAGRSLIWVLQRASLASSFEQVLVLENGSVVEHGKFKDYDREGTLVRQLMLSSEL